MAGSTMTKAPNEKAPAGRPETAIQVSELYTEGGRTSIADVVVAKIAGIAARVLRALLVRLRFDSLMRRTGVDQWLHRMGMRQFINDFIPRIGYFLLLFLFVRTADDALQLEAISSALGTLLAYLPNVIAALLILLFGGAVAQFVGGAVAGAAAGASLEVARPMGRLVSGVIMYVLLVMALAQLRIDTEFLRLITTAVLAGLSLAFGLSFGLGSRETTRNILAGFYARRTFRVGEQMEVGGERGVLRAITPTQTLLLQEGGQVVALANSALVEGVVKQ